MQDSIPCGWLALAGTGISPVRTRQLSLAHPKLCVKFLDQKIDQTDDFEAKVFLEQ
jgi:hypothetical protein